MEPYLPYLYEKGHGLEEYLEPQLTLAEEPGRVKERATDYFEGFQRELARPWSGATGLKGPAERGRGFRRPLRPLGGRPLRALCDLQTGLWGLRLQGLFQMPSLQAPDLQGQHKLLYDALVQLKAQGQSAFLFSGGQARGERLMETLRERGFDIRPYDQEETLPKGALRLAARRLFPGL